MRPPFPHPHNKKKDLAPNPAWWEALINHVLSFPTKILETIYISSSQFSFGKKRECFLGLYVVSSSISSPPLYFHSSLPTYLFFNRINTSILALTNKVRNWLVSPFVLTLILILIMVRKYGLFKSFIKFCTNLKKKNSSHTHTYIYKVPSCKVILYSPTHTCFLETYLTGRIL